MVNLKPTHPENGELKPPLESAHNAFGCTCRGVFDTYLSMRINHYLGSKGDFFDKTRSYWKVRPASSTVWYTSTHQGFYPMGRRYTCSRRPSSSDAKVTIRMGRSVREGDHTRLWKYHVLLSDPRRELWESTVLDEVNALVATSRDTAMAEP